MNDASTKEEEEDCRQPNEDPLQHNGVDVQDDEDIDHIKSKAQEDILAESYSKLQFFIGAIAFALPVIVAVGDKLIDDQGLRGSISSYYYGRTGGYFVGSLCAIGVFMFSYNYRPRPGREQDNQLSSIAGFAVICVALFPTSSSGAQATGGSQIVAYIHIASAAIFFIVLAIFSLFYFTRIDSESRGFRAALLRSVRDESGITEPRRLDNRVYRATGWIIVACLIGIVVNNLLGAQLVFWLESVIVWAFGISWLRKSQNVKKAGRALVRTASVLRQA